MALIGESKNNGLFQRVTSEGSKYRELKYKDVSDTEPLIHGYHKSPIDFLPTEGIPGVTEEAGGAGIISDVTREVLTRIDDTARITKLLATSQGIKWEGHNVGLAAIESTLAKKRGQYIGGTDIEGGFWSMLLSVGQNLVNGLMGALDITGVTLSQVAVAGTGAHFSSFILANRSYLGKSAADEALHSGKVTFTPAEDKDVHITDGYRQLPGMVNEAVQNARKPKIRGTAIDETSKGGVENYIDQVKSWWDKLVNGESGTSDIAEILGIKSSSGDIEEARKPGLPGSKIETIGDPRTEYSRGGGWLPENSNSEEIPYEETKLEEETNGDNGGSVGRWIGDNKIDDEDLGEARQPSMAAGHGDVPTEPQHEDAPSVSWPLENSYDDKTKYLDQFSSSIYQVGFNPGAQVYSEEMVSGPWKHDGVHALVAGTAGSKNTNYQKDDGQTRDYGSTRNMPTESNSTRVDNGRIDMIPFWIRAITSDDTVNANAYLFFEANLDSYSDNYDASWESTQYIGRADKFWTYTGFDRQISFSFKMVAHTKSHLKPIYNRLNGLLSMCTPSYGSNDVFMQGVLAEITIGDLLSRQLGFIKSVGLKWETDYMWETDEGTIRVPHVLDVSVGFTPIHQFIPKLRKRYFELVGDGAAGVPTFIVQHNKLYKK